VSERIDGGHLLVVDDNRLNRSTLALNLRKQGHTVVLAENGEQALELVRTQPFDLVLLDIVMPVMDGYQVLELIRGDPSLRSLPVIVISAVEEMESVVRCIGMGAADYLPKPFDPVLLRARIGACLENKRLHDQEVSYLAQISREKKRADDLLNVVIPLGVALAGERDLHRLLEKTVVEAMTFCSAEGGSLYLCNEDRLEAVIVRNRGGEAVPLPPPIPLRDPTTGEPNRRQIMAQAALAGLTVHVPDIQQDKEFDVSGMVADHDMAGGGALALLVIPLKDSSGRVIGLLQLAGTRHPDNEKATPFDDNLQQLVGSLSLLAAVAVEGYIREQSLRQEIKQLRIDLDRARQAKQVAEITDTEYFKQLRSDVTDLRKLLTRNR
jgi:CheY-like chemotaxis protein